MILLLGGTSETAPIAAALARAGAEVIVSLATDVSLPMPDHHRIRRRSGAMDETAMIVFCRMEKVRTIIDATHPYAELIHAAARSVAHKLDLRIFRYVRPSSSTFDPEGVQWAQDHENAAQLAGEWRKPVLLTIGSRHIAPYVNTARSCGIPLYARILSDSGSLAACARVGLGIERIITGRGPFSTEENRELIRGRGIGVLVTKESGAAGGFPQKVEAARLESCRLIVVQRPEEKGQQCCGTIEAIVAAAISETGRLE